MWGQSLVPKPQLPSPELWGWEIYEGQFIVNWTTQEPISKICKELCKCSCTKTCSGRCSCKKKTLPCTSICSCPCNSSEQEREDDISL